MVLHEGRKTFKKVIVTCLHCITVRGDDGGDTCTVLGNSQQSSDGGLYLLHAPMIISALFDPYKKSVLDMEFCKIITIAFYFGPVHLNFCRLGIAQLPHVAHRQGRGKPNSRRSR